MNLRQFLQSLFLAATWGASFLFLNIAVKGFGPAPLVLMRVGIATVILIIPTLISIGPTDFFETIRKNAKHLFIVGILNTGASFYLFAFAEQYLTAGIGSIINATTPLWVFLIANLWLKEPILRIQAIGIILGFLGVVTLISEQLFVPSPFSISIILTACAAGLTASLMYAIGFNYTKRYLHHVNPMINTTGSLLGSTIFISPFAYAAWPAKMPSFPLICAAVALGVVCTAIAYFVFFRLLAQVGQVKAGVVTFLVPVFGVLWGHLFLGEEITTPIIIGSTIILLGILLSTGMINEFRKYRASK